MVREEGSLVCGKVYFSADILLSPVSSTFVLISDTNKSKNKNYGIKIILRRRSG